MATDEDSRALPTDFSGDLRFDKGEALAGASEYEASRQNHFREWFCRQWPQPIVVLSGPQSSERAFFCGGKFPRRQ